MTDKRSDMLLVEDLMLLLMDDDGASIQAASTLYYVLGGAVLTELSMLGRLEADDSGSLNGHRITTVGDGPLPDPLLQATFDIVKARPQRVQPLLVAVGADLGTVVTDRLLEKGLLRRQERKVLGLFKTTRLPAADGAHEAQVRAQILQVLQDDVEPDPRTAALIGLLSASGALPSLRPPLPWTGKTASKAYALQSGQWGTAAVADAVQRTTAAIVAASAAAAVAASTSHR